MMADIDLLDVMITLQGIFVLTQYRKYKFGNHQTFLTTFFDRSSYFIALGN